MLGSLIQPRALLTTRPAALKSVCSFKYQVEGVEGQLRPGDKAACIPAGKPWFTYTLNPCSGFALDTVCQAPLAMNPKCIVLAVPQCSLSHVHNTCNTCSFCLYCKYGCGASLVPCGCSCCHGIIAIEVLSYSAS